MKVFEKLKEQESLRRIIHVPKSRMTCMLKLNITLGKGH